MSVPPDATRWWRCAAITVLLGGGVLVVLWLVSQITASLFGLNPWDGILDSLLKKGEEKAGTSAPDGPWGNVIKYGLGLTAFVGMISLVYKTLATPIDFFVFSEFDSKVLTPIQRVTGLTPWVPLEEGSVVSARERLHTAAWQGGGDGRWGKFWPAKPEIPEPVAVTVLVGPNCVGKSQLCFELARELCQRGPTVQQPSTLRTRLEEVFKVLRCYAAAETKGLAWDAGILAAGSPVHREATLKRLESWRPRRRTLMILDDAPQNWPSEVSKALAQRSSDYWYPVRLLIIDQLIPVEAPAGTSLRLGEIRLSQADLSEVVRSMRQQERLPDDALQQLWSPATRQAAIGYCDGNPYLVAVLLRKLARTREPLSIVFEQLRQLDPGSDDGTRASTDRHGLAFENASRLVRDRVAELLESYGAALTQARIQEYEQRRSVVRAVASATLAGGLPFNVVQDRFGVAMDHDLASKLGSERNEDEQGNGLLGPVRPLWVGAVFVEKVLSDAGDPAIGRQILTAAWSANPAQTAKTLAVWPGSLVARLLHGLDTLPASANDAEAMNEAAMLAHLSCQRTRRAMPGVDVLGRPQVRAGAEQLQRLLLVRFEAMPSKRRRELIGRLATLPQNPDVNKAAAIALVASLWSQCLPAVDAGSMLDEIDTILHWLQRWLSRFEDNGRGNDAEGTMLASALLTVVEKLTNAVEAADSKLIEEWLVRIDASIVWPASTSDCAALQDSVGPLCDLIERRWSDTASSASAAAWRMGLNTHPGTSVDDRLFALRAWRNKVGTPIDGGVAMQRACVWAALYTCWQLANGSTMAKPNADAVRECADLAAKAAAASAGHALLLATARTWRNAAYVLSMFDAEASLDATRRVDEIIARDTAWAGDRDMQLERARAWRYLAFARKDDAHATLKAIERVDEIAAQNAAWASDRDMQHQRAQAWRYLAFVREGDAQAALEAVERVDAVAAQIAAWATDRDLQLERARAWCHLAFARMDDAQAALEAVERVDEVAAQVAAWTTDRDMQLERAQAWRHLAFARKDDAQSTLRAVERVDEIATQVAAWATDRDMQLERAQAWRYLAFARRDDAQSTLQAVERVEEIAAQTEAWATDRDMQLERAQAWCNLAFARKDDAQSTLQAVGRVEEIAAQVAAWATDRDMQLKRAQAWCQLAFARSDAQATLEAVEHVDEIVAQTEAWATDRDMQFERAQAWCQLAFARKDDAQATFEAVKRVEEIVAQIEAWATDRDMQFKRAQAWRYLAFARKDDAQSTLRAVERVDEIAAQVAAWTTDRDMQLERAQAWCQLAFARRDDAQSTLQAVERVEQIAAQTEAWATNRDMQLERAQAWCNLAFAHKDDAQSTLQAVGRVEEIAAQVAAWATDRDMQLKRAQAWCQLAFARSDAQATLEAVEHVDEIVAQTEAWATDRDMQFKRAQAWCQLAFARTDDAQATFEAVERVDDIAAQVAAWATDRDMQLERAQAWRYLAYAFMPNKRLLLTTIDRINSIVAAHQAWGEDLGFRTEQIYALNFAVGSSVNSGDADSAAHALARLTTLCAAPCDKQIPIEVIPQVRSILEMRLDALWHLFPDPRPPALLDAARLLGRDPPPPSAA